MTAASHESRLTVRTRAKGLLAKLAHDLEIGAERLAVELAIDGERWTAELRVPVSALRVRGAVKDGAVDADILSGSDRADIEQRIAEALPGAAITVRASGDTRRGEATVKAPRGEARVPLSIERRDTTGTARGTLSLKSLGIPEIKGPLGAFKLDDTVTIELTIVLGREGESFL